MSKEKIHLEYLLNSGSVEVIWNMISTISGLERWFADQITCTNKEYTFRWGKDEIRTAKLTNIRLYSFIRFHWTDDEEPRTFFELRMEENELTGVYVLSVTDYADKGEEEDMKDLWDSQIDRLRRGAGL